MVADNDISLEFCGPRPVAARIFRFQLINSFKHHTTTTMSVTLFNRVQFRAVTRPHITQMNYGNMNGRNFQVRNLSTNLFSKLNNNQTPKNSQTKEKSTIRPFTLFSEGPTAQLVQKYYETNHAPIGFTRPNGPPYTDTSKLEKDLPDNEFGEHYKPDGFQDYLAWGLVRFARIFTHLFFRDKYGHHAVVLETVAAVPGMVAGMMRHLRALRNMERDYGWIGKLLEEAENERMHLLTWMQLVRPTPLERLLVFLAQMVYTPLYATIYFFSPRTAHRFVGYLEEEACYAYTEFLHAIDKGSIPNVDAPDIAKKYWNLAPDAKLRDVVLVVRADEAMHRNVNHIFGDKSKHGIH